MVKNEMIKLGSIVSLDGTIKEVIEYFQELKIKYGEDAYIEIVFLLHDKLKES